MKRVMLSAMGLSIVLLSGCGSSDATTNDTTDQTQSGTSNSADTRDITDAILTNRSANCADYVASYASMVKDIQNNTAYDGSLTISVANNECTFTANSIPNHDFNDATAHFATPASEQSINVSVPSSPSFAASDTALDLGDNAIFLNGVLLSILSAGCYDVADGNIGCNDINEPFRYDPMSPLVNFGTDQHNAHVQPDGKYHYHGNPMALFDTQGTSESPVIGFARDGYPIYGSYINDNGTIRKVTSSYQLKSGTRDAVTYNSHTYNPGGTYDGSYTSDYEYVAGLGDLDACNGMTRDGAYGYYVTDAYPWVLGCYKGTPDSSFGR
ncbi:MAG: YHYH protein [Epsilonproteobacteria bacterium]|nr:YHYH protein [Campylobacterota bacterium]